MRDVKRIEEVTRLLGTLWSYHPDWRFGQMLINHCIVKDDYNTWSNEDNGFIEYLKKAIVHQQRASEKFKKGED